MKGKKTGGRQNGSLNKITNPIKEAITDFTNVLLRNLFLQKNDVSILIYDLNNACRNQLQ